VLASKGNRTILKVTIANTTQNQNQTVKTQPWRDGAGLPTHATENSWERVYRVCLICNVYKGINKPNKGRQVVQDEDT